MSRLFEKSGLSSFIESKSDLKRQRVTSPVGSDADEPDGRNPGVGKTESLITYAAAIAATFLVRRALHLSWQTALKRDPPKNPASRSVAWKDALLWGALSGAIVGIARIGSRRATSAAYRSYRGVHR